jgi:hypothetical protein
MVNRHSLFVIRCSLFGIRDSLVRSKFLPPRLARSFVLGFSCPRLRGRVSAKPTGGGARGCVSCPRFESRLCEAQTGDERLAQRAISVSWVGVR